MIFLLPGDHPSLALAKVRPVLHCLGELLGSDGVGIGRSGVEGADSSFGDTQPPSQL